MSKRRTSGCKKTIPTFRGNAWAMPSAAAATVAYRTVLDHVLDRDPEDWSLVSGLFQRKRVLVFSWTVELAPTFVATVQRTIRTAGGKELDEETKATLIAHVLARRRGLQAKKPCETLIAHHPKGTPVWDLED